MSADSPDALARTPLYDLHVELGARMVPFAGYTMPVQYAGGIIAEHTHTRTRAALFDVSHMGQIRVSGNEAARALETLMPAAVAELPPGRQCYSVLTNDTGGILDDLMIANLGEAYLLVVNAARKGEDFAYLRTQLGGDCSVELLDDRALVALQGPTAHAVLSALAAETAALPFMGVTTVTLEDTECTVSRSGYTGEDGFEISLPARRAQALARRLLAHADVAPAGLGARDSLRLEAGLCLYGQDLDPATTPIEADLAWVIPRVRRPGGRRAGGYPGADIIARQLTHGPERRRVGLKPHSRAPVRAGCELLDDAGEPAGKVTSGGFGPTVGEPLAMGYATLAQAAPDTMLQAVVRGKPVGVRVTPLPFVRRRYHRGA